MDVEDTKYNNTKELILDAAEALLQDRGFNAFSYHHIAQQLGVKNAAIHYHFTSKTDLGTTLIRRFRQRFRDYTRTLERENAGPVSKLECYFAIPASYLQNGRKICPLGVLEAEFNAIPEPMQLESRLLDKEMRDWLAGVLDDGRSQGVFNFEGSIVDKTLVVVAALQGVLQIARVAGPQIFSVTVRQIKRELGVLEKAV
ncbi:MAG: TetR/AcrR family transcriptional regulator [Fidelibacterota bacterium]|nr:MAG: TetR/AcrR family transcriptional regulator [Candidatus Neomarinimicrobiota bacterium]